MEALITLLIVYLVGTHGENTMKNPRNKTRARNPYVIPARVRSGAGSHKHPKHTESRNACRNWRYDPDNEDN